jgi:WD40 repeat protein
LSPLKEIKLPCPPESSSVRGLVFGTDGLLRGASFGKDVWLFTYDPQQAKIVSSMNLFEHQPSNRSFHNGSLAAIAGNKFAVSYLSPVEGHLYGLGGITIWQSTKPTNSSKDGYHFIASGSSDFVALVGDPKSPFLYGLSATSSIVRYEVEKNTFDKAKDLGRMWVDLQPYTERKNLPRVLILDADGTVYTTGKEGFIFRGSNEGKPVMVKVARTPFASGSEQLAGLDAAVLGPDGLIYGGTFDGYVFTFNPKTNGVVNLGKPLHEGGIQGLAFSKGKLIGIGGTENTLQAFAFDPKKRSFELAGALKTADEKTITTAVGAMVADKNGNIYLGTTGKLGGLYVCTQR